MVGNRPRIGAGLDRLEAAAGQRDGPLIIAPIAVATAMAYMELRECLTDWRETRPRLAAWYEAFRRRPSMVETEW